MSTPVKYKIAFVSQDGRFSYKATVKTREEALEWVEKNSKESERHNGAGGFYVESFSENAERLDTFAAY